MNRLFQIQEELRIRKKQFIAGKYSPSVTMPGDGAFAETEHHAPQGADGYSAPFYSTGEHVLTGEGHAILAGRTLTVNGVAFEYSEIITMGDLFETYDDMIKAYPMHLWGLQRLIKRSRDYHAARMAGWSSGILNVTDADWQSATGGRYLKLAEENYAHFAPSNSTLLPGFFSKKKNHKTEWENYHRRAIEHARRGADSLFLDEALVINAFGDHFLTDAFAAGHLFNKDDINQYFKSRMFSGGSLNSAGQKFFERVAEETFNGKVKDAFSPYEIPTRDRDKLWIKWNIDTTNAFRKMLIQIMEKEPDLFGKTVVAGAVHDILNNPKVRAVLPVRNNRGDRWNIVGDGTLDAQNLQMIKNAVAQSIQNIYDAAVADRTIPVTTLQKKAWDFTPQPEQAAVTEIKRFINLYTDPSYLGLVLATRDMIRGHYQDILDELVKRGYLQHE